MNLNRQRFRWAARCTVLLVAVGLTVSWFVAGRLVAPQPRLVGDPPAGLDATSISIANGSRATVAGWHIQGKQRKGAIVLLHPFRSSRLTMTDRARFLSEAGYSIVLIDLQGHGETPGEQITVGHLERHDVHAAVEFARQQHPGEPVAVLGVSLGGAATLLAAPLNVDAMILESVYSTIHQAVRNRVETRMGVLAPLPTWLLLAQLQPRLGVSPTQLRPIDKLAETKCPILLISGKEDRYTTVDETQRMYSLAVGPKELWLVDGAAHVDIHSFTPQEYQDRVLSFLDEYMKKSAD